MINIPQSLILLLEPIKYYLLALMILFVISMVIVFERPDRDQEVER
jgi:hypothetical protein